MTDDIVARLREFDADLTKEIENGEHGKEGEDWVIPFDCLCEAADEIERLREMLRLEREESAACAINRKETQRERDEARQEILESMHPYLRKRYAAARGWNCFEENNDEH